MGLDMKKLIIITVVVLLISLSACSGESYNISSFSITSSDVTIYEASTDEYYIILAVEFANKSNEILRFKESDFDIVDEDGKLIDTMYSVCAYPSTVAPNKTGVYYCAKLSNNTSDLDMKLTAIPHIEVDYSTLTNNQLNQFTVTGATIGGNSYCFGTIRNKSSRYEYHNVCVALIGRTLENKVISVMTSRIETIRPFQTVEFRAEAYLKQRIFDPDIKINYNFFVYIDQ